MKVKYLVTINRKAIYTLTKKSKIVISFGGETYSLNMYINLFHIGFVGNRGDGLTCMKEIFVLLIRKLLLQINW